MTAVNTGIFGDVSDVIGIDEIQRSDSKIVSEINPGVGVDPSGNSDADDVVRHLNSLLRGEISAAETYRNALEKASTGDHAELAQHLRLIQREHGQACLELRNRVRELGGDAVESSGAWGTWAAVVQGALTLFGGESGALKALKEGEEHGLKDFHATLPHLDLTSANVVERQFIPAQQRHIALLDQLMA